MKEKEPQGIIGSCKIEFDIIPGQHRQRLTVAVDYFEKKDQYGMPTWVTGRHKTYFMDYDPSTRAWKE